MSRRARASLWLTLASMALTAVVYVVRLEGRITTQDTAIANVQADHEKADQLILEELRYIRGRVDQLAGSSR